MSAGPERGLSFREKDMRVHIDFETRSKIDLTARGAWIYSRDLSTSPLCIGYALGDGPVKLAHPAFPGVPAVNWPPKELLDAVADRSNTVHAHNAFFERVIWKNVCNEHLGWPEVLPEQWRCTLSVCSYKAIPRSLEKAALFLKLPFTKDMAGNKAMLRCSRPKEDGSWHEDDADLKKMFAYCMVDVEVERALENKIGVLPDYEQKIWCLDQILNEKGVRLDRALAKIAMGIAEEQKGVANVDLFDLTRGAVIKTSARKTFTDWSKTQGFDMTGVSLAADKIEEVLKNEAIPKSIREAVEIKCSVAASSVAKYKAVLAYTTDSDPRARDNLQYFGAGTGRWAGKGVQFHNFPRGYGAWSKKNPSTASMEMIIEQILRSEIWESQLMTGERPMTILKKITRGLLVPEPGKEYLIVDYSSVEARGVMWLAGEEEGIKALKEGDIYCAMASVIFGYEVFKDQHPAERQLGKAVILGAGYQMGYVKFLVTIEKDGISLSEALVRKLLGDRFEEYKTAIAADAPAITRAGLVVKDKWIALIGAKFLIDSYRNKYAKVRNLWREIESAARDAMKNPYERIRCEKVEWEYDPLADFLYCYLPSGRCINYPGATLDIAYTLVVTGRNKKGREVKARLQVDSLEGSIKKDFVDNLRAKGYRIDSDEPEVWTTEKISYIKTDKSGMSKKTATYGGKIVENCVQGICRDILAEALQRAEERGFNPIISVHDEIICETPVGEKKLKDLEEILCESPSWAEGFPIAAEGFQCLRYRK